MVVLGLVIMYYAHKFKFKYLSRLSQMAIWLVAGLLLLTLAFGANINDASRWLTIPIINQNFQTSDLAKVVLIIYVARMLALRKDKLHEFNSGARVIILPILLICGLIFPANFSTAAILFLVCLILMFVGKVPVKHILLIIGIGVAGMFLMLLIAKSYPELLPRLDTWITRIESHNSQDSDANYQVENAKIAIAQGGLLPNGPGSGTSRNFLPHPYSDMIYAFIIEEYGSLLGGMGIILLYMILLYRAVRISIKSETRFGALVAIGLSLMLVVQAMTNMAVAVNLVPVTGQPLPLVSMGGTSIWFTCLAIGIILSISRTIQPKKSGKNGRRSENGELAFA
jgi:cell division protein FtsW